MTPIEQIKEKIDIVEFIGSYIELKPAGKNFKAICPFHSEKTPSFMVSSERQTWHCFGACAEGGDIFKFLMKYENLEFYEALKFLAEKAGVELKKISPSDQRQFGVLYDINESAKDFFKSKLPQSKSAVDYLKSRGLKAETAAEFEIGISPDSFDELTVYLINRGYDVKDIERAGLNYKNDNGKYIDRFRNRIMFPVYSHFGKVVGFSARVLPEHDTGETGKYINSPETPIYNKSRVLYGFHKSKGDVRRQNSALMVEGQMDFLMCWQDGIKNVVATSGTALTVDHLRALKKSAEQIVFAFDNDEAGLKAAERSIDLANAFDFSVKILVLKEYKDPAEAVQKNSGFMGKAALESKHAIEFYISRYLNKEAEANPLDFKKNTRVVLAKIKNIASPVEQNYWIKKLAEIFGVNELNLVQEMEKLKNVGKQEDYGKFPDVSAVVENQTRKELIAERLLTLAAIKDSLPEKLKDSLKFFPEKHKKAFDLILKKEIASDPEIIELMNNITLRSGLEIEKLGEGKIETEFEELLKNLKLEFFKEHKKELSVKIKKLEKDNDEENLSLALKEFKEFDEMSKLLQN